MRKILIDNKDLMLEWDCNKNKGLDPQKITQGSGKYAWWKCKNRNSWIARIKNRKINKYLGRFATREEAMIAVASFKRLFWEKGII